MIFYRFNSDPKAKIFESDVNFEGTVTEFDNSGGHGFGIIRFKVLKSNIQIFNAFQNGKVYFYNINGEDGEIYSYVPASLRKGDMVYVDSEKRKLLYYRNTKLLTEGDFMLITEDNWIEYVKKEKRLNN